MSNDNPHAILMLRSMDLGDAAGAYALAAKATADRLAKAKKLRDQDGLDDVEYLKLLKTIQAEDQLMTSAAKNLDKAVELRDKPISSVIMVDYDAKLKAIK
jgi:ribosomal protein L4